jgi:signal transduction histidine kinase/CheY-like chemotaxis protein
MHARLRLLDPGPKQGLIDAAPYRSCRQMEERLCAAFRVHGRVVPHQPAPESIAYGQAILSSPTDSVPGDDGGRFDMVAAGVVRLSEHDSLSCMVRDGFRRPAEEPSGLSDPHLSGGALDASRDCNGPNADWCVIHLSGGRIETHFHVFGSLAFLAFYRDIPVLATATVIVSLDHLIRGLLIPESVYGVITTSNWRFIEHAFWVVFENIFLVSSAIHGRAQISAMASQQAQLEEMNEKIEAAVRERTRELSQKTEELGAARDAAMESTRLKSQFLANVSHEIRTPMNGVLGMTSLLLDTDLTEDQRDCALTVQRSAEGLLTIINDILDFSKIEAGKLALERVDFFLSNVVEDVARLLTEPAERKQLELVCKIHSSVPSVVSGDAGRFRQILINLMGNAVKFSERGEVTVRALQVDRNGSISRVRFEVADTGIGIAEDAQKKLFQAFVQVDGSTTRKHEGTGLGLAISKQLVDLMGGEIGCDSVPGIGSKFWFEIPLDVISVSDETKNIQWDALRGLRILIVDDHCTNRKVMLRTVSSWGMEVEQAADGREALIVLEAAIDRGEPFDLAVLDLQMPGMDGIQLARAIWERDNLQSTRLLLMDCQMPIVDGFEATTAIRGLPGLAGQIPIIAVTANAMVGDRERCLAAGMTSYITKPVSLAQLTDALNIRQHEPALVS